ncbi:RICIN domain-containing protein [Streptomyces sp. XM83C]|jgi:hypothetical protein|uniref:RICIN domain-containing protein n=1 Tax=Streptomyces thermocoprophilus TaxID=78356 RepID=A0ABV5VLE6_9ACTN|nr:helix-turn-helix domain-containing protein [Streptomyces sp. XM83C]MCK1818825.1 RICIN domain-containing protein [Streptomyces sp. XM83C]
MPMTDPRRHSLTPAQRLGAALRALQQRSGCTLRALEQQVRISDSSISRYFRGDTVPTWDAVRDLCRAMGADPMEYRRLWEAADGTRPEVPHVPAPAVAAAPVSAPAPGSAVAPDGEPAVPVTVVTVAETAPQEPATRAGRLRRLFAGRWAFAVAGAVAGLSAGAAVALFTAPHTPFAPQAQGPAVLGEASHRSPGDTRIFVNRATGACMDDSLEHGLRTYGCNGLPYQRWTLRTLPDGTRQIRNHATGRCISDTGNGPRTEPCGDSTAQRWTTPRGDDEAVPVRSTVTGRCLTDATAGLRSLPCEDIPHQKWA